jgi:cytochrome c553
MTARRTNSCGGGGGDVSEVACGDVWGDRFIVLGRWQLSAADLPKRATRGATGKVRAKAQREVVGVRCRGIAEMPRLAVLLVLSLACATFCACAKSSDSSSATAGAGVDRGSAIFTQNCAGCHGQAGAGGGIGPSLKGEKARKNLAAAIAWIENPKAPMPKLYPSPLSEKDVADVAAYVESL